MVRQTDAFYNTPKSFTIETNAYTMMFCPHQLLKLVFLVLHAAQRLMISALIQRRKAEVNVEW